MSQALHTLGMTQDEFVGWVERQDERYEFDGFGPVAVVESSLRHSRIAQNIWRVADRQLAGTGCEAFVQDGGVAIPSGAIRFPRRDDHMLCRAGSGAHHSDPRGRPRGAESSGGTIDRIVKLEEYRTVSSIKTYVIVEQEIAALTVYRRQGESIWAATVLGLGDTFLAPAARLLRLSYDTSGQAIDRKKARGSAPRPR